MSTVSYIDPQPSQRQAAAPRRAGRRARIAGWALSVLETPAEALAAWAGQPWTTGRHAQSHTAEPCDPAPVVPPNTFSTAADIDPAEIDPRLAVAELAQSAAPARRAVDMFHTAYPDLPRGELRWTVLDDGAVGRIDSLDADTLHLHGVVAAYASALGVKVEYQPHPHGHLIVSAAGAYWGVRIVVEATCARPVDDDLLVFQETAPTPAATAGGDDR